MKCYSNNDVLYIGLYVDDIIICGNNVDKIVKLKHIIANTYKCKDLGPIKKYLGMCIHRNRQDKTITVSMQSYINDILEQYCMSDCNIRDAPCECNKTFTKDMCPVTDTDINYMKSIPYSNIVGSLLYLSITCRPDISYIVGILSRFMQNPGIPHWQGAKAVLRYLKGTSHLGITYGGKEYTSISAKNVLCFILIVIGQLVRIKESR